MVRDWRVPAWAILAAICFFGCNAQTDTSGKKSNAVPEFKAKKSNLVPGYVIMPKITPKLAVMLEVADLCKNQGANVVIGITSLEFAPRSSLANLAESSVQTTPINDRTFAAIAAELETVNSIQSIRSLRLVTTNITDRGLEHVKKFDRLELLDLSSSLNITDVGLHHLKTIKSLRLLIIRGCTRISSKGKADLRRHFKEVHFKTLLITGP